MVVAGPHEAIALGRVGAPLGKRVPEVFPGDLAVAFVHGKREPGHHIGQAQRHRQRQDVQHAHAEPNHHVDGQVDLRIAGFLGHGEVISS